MSTDLLKLHLNSVYERSENAGKSKKVLKAEQKATVAKSQSKQVKKIKPIKKDVNFLGEHC